MWRGAGPTVGSIALAYVLGGDADVVPGLILDAPMGDHREAMRLRSGEAAPVGGVIGDALLVVDRAFVSARTGLDLDEFNPVPDGEHVRAWSEDPGA